eukprot:4629445-Amphidinium_carterae.2
MLHTTRFHKEGPNLGSSNCSPFEVQILDGSTVEGHTDEHIAQSLWTALLPWQVLSGRMRLSLRRRRRGRRHVAQAIPTEPQLCSRSKQQHSSSPSDQADASGSSNPCSP